MPRAWWRTDNQAAFSLVEIILASSVFVLLVTALVGAYLYGEESTTLAGNRARAALLAEEGLEAARNIRDANFSNLSDGTHGFAIAGNQWTFSGSSDINNIFTRNVAIATIDPHRKSVNVNVTWQQNAQRSGLVSLASELTYWASSWANPTTSGLLDLAGANDGRKIAFSGQYAYVIRNNTSSNFVVIDVSNPASPSLTATLSVIGTPVNIAVSGTYAYVTSSDNNSELIIVDISNPASPSVAGSYNAPSTADGAGVFAAGTTVYLGRANSTSDEFSVINASNPASPVLVGSLNMGDAANEITVMGNYAYIASSSNNQELQVVNISAPATPSLAGSLNLTGTTNALTIAGFGSTIVIGQGNTLYTVNVTAPASPILLGSINTGGAVNDIDLGNSNTYVFVADANSASEFQVVDISSPATPSALGAINIAGTNILFGVVYDNASNRAYAVGNNNNEEFLVFSPQ